jgi:hypothetical protein
LTGDPEPGWRRPPSPSPPRCIRWARPPPERPAWRGGPHLLGPDERITFAASPAPGHLKLITSIRAPAPGDPGQPALFDEDSGPSGKSIAIGLGIAAGVILVGVAIVYLVALFHAAHQP